MQAAKRALPDTVLVPFTDYSRWERKPRRAVKLPETHAIHRPVVSYGPRPAQHPPPACNHGHGRRRKVPPLATGGRVQTSEQQASLRPKSPPKRLHQKVQDSPPVVKILKVSPCNCSGTPPKGHP